MLDITLLLLMLYVLSLPYISMLIARYYRFYTVVAYDIYGQCWTVTRVGRVLLLSSYEHLCDRVVYIHTYYLHFYNTTYYVFLTYHFTMGDC